MSLSLNYVFGENVNKMIDRREGSFYMGPIKKG